MAQLETLNDADKDPDPNYWAVLAKALNTKARLQWKQGQLEEALTTWQEADRIYFQTNNIDGVIRTKINQAQALQRLGLSHQAKRVLEAVNQNLADQPDSDLKATGLQYLGRVLKQLGDLQASQEQLNASLVIAQDPILTQSIYLEGPKAFTQSV